MKQLLPIPQNNGSGSHFNPEQQVIIVMNRQLIRRLMQLLLLAGAVILVIWMLPYIKSLLTPLGIALFLSYILKPWVNKLENAGINRGAAVGIVFLILAGAIFIGLKMLLPGLSQEFKTLAQAVQSEDTGAIIDKLQATLSQQIPILKNPNIAREVSIKLHNFSATLLRKSFNLIFAIISSFTYIITVPFMMFFILKDGRRIKKFIIQVVPNRYFEMSLNLFYKANSQLGNYIRGQLLVSSIIATLSIIALYSLNIPYFFIIGVIAGLANMIPYFGPIVGALPGVIVAIVETGSMESVIGVIVAFALIQLLDNVLFSPVIVSKSVQVHPLLVILVILIGGNIAGILGMLVAVPIFAVAQVFVKEIIWSFKHYRLTT
ncbi:MAG: AI-2E family transporter [candidate division KSB1 bacterium]|nr:AI-2E family transporter [candidate division KSB1 bacterium]MDZ7341801.1 AI-2E family transporter [candidate division KSB1 bacterium]